ncbi:MAG: hypothetical protein IJ485_03360 [Lachnospiraceae bacterium]|nr:hypothetical protein [Lachnospiraceae bacterium]
MKKALNKDTIRTIWKEKKRFISIMLITMLGVTIMTGLSAGCQDLRYSADRFMDSQELFDISVMSTLGLTEEDVEVFQSMDIIEKAEGAFSEVVHTKKGDLNKTAEVKMIKTDGLNLPYIVDGNLPECADEIAVTQNYIAETGKQIGDVVEIEEIIEIEEKEEKEDEETEVELEEAEIPNFLTTDFTITGVVIDVMDINNAEGSAGFRATPNADYTFFVTPESIESDVYTAIYLSLRGTSELLCYSEEYEAKTGAVISMIEAEIMEQREQARYDEITGEAYDKISEAEEEMNEKFAEAEQEFAEAEEEISEGWQEIEDGKQELTDKQQEVAQEIADARKEIEDGYEQLKDGEEELRQAEEELVEGTEQLNQGKQELMKQEKSTKAKLRQAEEQLNTKIQENEAAAKLLEENLAGLTMLFGEEWTKEEGIQSAFEDYVGAATAALLPMIKEQMNGEQTGTEEEIQQEMQQVLQQNSEVQAAQGTLFAKLNAAAVTILNTVNSQNALLQSSITELEEAIQGLETLIAGLLTQEEALQNDIEVLETEIAELEKQEEPDQTVLTAKKEALATKQAELKNIQENCNEAKAQLESSQSTKMTLETQKEALQTHKDSLEKMQTENFTDIFQLAAGMAQSDAAAVVLEEAKKELNVQKKYAEKKLAEAWKQIEVGEQGLAQGRTQLAEGWQEIADNRQKLEDGVAEISENEQKASEEFAEAWDELADGEKELLDGEEELEENRIEFEEEKADAIQKIEEAREKIADIDMTQWYVQDRTSLSGYSNVKSDAEAIESLASVFIVVFFIVAILISLTTVTRMVEEGRGLIGTYKALGFTDHEIRKKYVVYALAASVLGGLLGDVGGFVILPKILFIFFDVMYMLPAYFIQFNFMSGIISVILFVIGIVGAAIMACYAELKHLPAHLMRPKAPKMGSRVFLEYITPVWKRFSFLNKVTARNLFRYKKRLIMTVFGIMGCTALLLFGFAIKDSVSELMPMQYENIYKYDLLAATSAEDNEKLIEYLEHSEEVEAYLNIQVESVKVKNAEGYAEKVQLFVFPNEASIEEYVTLSNAEYEPVSLEGDGIYLTENAAKILELEKGETVAVQKMNLEQEETVIADRIKNYLGNNVYMSQKAYETIFGKYEPNGILANLSDTCTDQIAFSDTLAEEDWIMSSVSTEELKEGFSAAFTLINIVVYVVLVLAAGLAFVVLFTLASVNISERIRELATIKVLGFFDKEVHLYVNKETLILTALGILFGLPLGAALSTTLTTILNMPSIYFAVTIYNRSYFFAAGLAFLFAFMVQLMTDRSLNEIDPVEALKSVE